MEEAIDPRILLRQIARILDELSIEYVVSGGMAVVVWGRPRYTADIDTVVKLKEDDVSKLVRALKTLGKAGYIDERTAHKALRQKGEFNFIDSNSGMKADFWVAGDDEFSRKQFERRVAQDIDGQKVYFLSPEDLILSKLLWHKSSPSERQIEDVESIFKISGDKLDTKYLALWAEKLSVYKFLSRFLK